MKIKFMNIWDEQIEQIKEWKRRPPKIRQYYCPFSMSSIGGKICAKAFKRCNHNPNKYPPIPLYDYSCFTTPCPCQIYTFGYVMSKAKTIVKYGRI